MGGEGRTGWWCSIGAFEGGAYAGVLSFLSGSSQVLGVFGVWGCCFWEEREISRRSYMDGQLSKDLHKLFGSSVDCDIFPSGLESWKLKTPGEAINAGKVHVIGVVCFPGYVTSSGVRLQQHPRIENSLCLSFRQGSRLGFAFVIQVGFKVESRIKQCGG